MLSQLSQDHIVGRYDSSWVGLCLTDRATVPQTPQIMQLTAIETFEILQRFSNYVWLNI